MVASVAVPRELAERAREIAAGRLSPVVPRDAATVMLLRERAGVEAYLLRRTRELDFAPGACVFPGGSVDERDADPEIGWAGPSPAEVADQLAAYYTRRRTGRRDGPPGDDAEEPASGVRLRSFLSARMPSFMVPAVFIALDQMPLTPEGKLDRQALPSPVTAASGSLEAGRTPVQAGMSHLWSRMLGTGRIG